MHETARVSREVSQASEQWHNENGGREQTTGREQRSSREGAWHWEVRHCQPVKQGKGEAEVVLRRAAAAAGECPKKVSALVDLPTALLEFAGGLSQMSHLSFLRVWSHIKNNNLQDPTNRNIVNCDDKLKSVLLGRYKVELSELPMLVKLHFPKVSKSYIKLQL